jgi:pimeloyl-ACP methyl ester carboxylesterase
MTWQAFGEGPTLCLVPGFPDGAVAWAGFAERVAATGRRACVLDLFGPGAPRGRGAIGEQRLRLAAFLRGAFAAPPAILAHDLGGLLAWLVGGPAPQLARSWSVVAAPHPSRIPDLRAWRGPLRRRYLHLLGAPGLGAWLTRRCSFALPRRVLAPLPPDLRADCVAHLAGQGRLDAALAMYRDLARVPVQHGAIAAPVHAASCRGDPWVSATSMISPGEAPGPVELPTSSHFPHVTDPEVLLRWWLTVEERRES